jgi:Family of unknown function (DUF6510)
MKTMDALDGNAIAGPLFEHFGDEMTTATGACKRCGTRAQIAELSVYMRAPGMVARCRVCGNVVIVITRIHGALRVDYSYFKLASASSST